MIMDYFKKIINVVVMFEAVSCCNGILLSSCYYRHHWLGLGPSNDLQFYIRIIPNRSGSGPSVWLMLMRYVSTYVRLRIMTALKPVN